MGEGSDETVDVPLTEISGRQGRWPVEKAVITVAPEQSKAIVRTQRARFVEGRGLSRDDLHQIAKAGFGDPNGST